MPLIVFVAVSDVDHAEVIEEPGAKMSTQVPQFEKEERESLEADPVDLDAVSPLTRQWRVIYADVVMI